MITNERKGDTIMGGRGAMLDIPRISGGEEPRSGFGASGIDKLPMQGATRTITDAVTHTNPNYDDGYDWKINCNKCVLAYPMQRMGYDVTAGANMGEADTFGYGFDRDGNPRLDIPNYITAWKNPTITGVSGTGQTAYKDIVNQMNGYGSGAMAIVRVRWKGGHGHVFMVENHNGQIHFVDPQPSSAYGGTVSKGEIIEQLNSTHNYGNKETKLIRIDNAGINEDIMKQALLPRIGDQVRRRRRT